jgi:HlyD family secretion protein
VAQSTIQLKEALLDMDYYILDLEKRQKRYEALMRSDSLAKQEFEAVEDELEYRRDKRELMIERIRQEDLLNAQQLAQAETSIVRLNRSLDLLTQIVDSLEVRAPISGHLSSIDAETGQSIGRGQRIGQIDILDQFKIRVEIDQYYVSRIGVGTEGRFRVDQQDYPVVVRKIYPEVTDNTFSVDADFVGEVPTSIRRGQSLTVELNFGEPEHSLMVRKGGFYQQTNGRWVYLISEDGKTATRTEIRLGRQNPQFVEVLEGLREGDWVITSGYDNFNEIEELKFSDAIDL